MKNSISRFILTGAVISSLTAIAVCLPQSVHAQTNSAPPPPPSATPAADSPDSQAQRAATVKAPPTLFPTSPLAQVVRLAQAGVEPGIILTYITNSSSTFNLDSDKIIYASDAGVPSTMVAAMMQRDLYLQEQFAAAQAAQLAQQVQPVQPAPAPAPAPETAPAETADAVAPPESQPVTINYFYDSLAPYGNWVTVNGYGRCWRPTACVYNSSWQPYCDRGRWVYSDCGWYWNSDYAWGATFHYGRWFSNPAYGWCWYPDTVWAPSWVTWRYSDNYCGWAPLPPGTGCQAGVGIVYNGGGVSVGFGFGLGASCFTFVPTQYFCNYYPRNYCLPPAQCSQVYNNTTVINNYGFHNHTIANQGIGVDHFAAGTHTPIHPVPVRDISAGAAHGVYARGNYVQPVYSPGANGPANAGNSGAPIQAAAAAPNHFASPGQNRNTPPAARPQHNLVVASIPQRQLPAAGYYSPPAATTRAPQPAFSPSQQPAPASWQPARSAGTPRNAPQNYAAPQQYHSAPAAVAAPQHSAPQYAAPQRAAPQHSAPANAPSGNPGSQGGYHGGYAGGPAR